MQIIQKIENLLRTISVGSFLAGLLFALLGIVLVYLGSDGETEFSFFGQGFKSTNVGIAAIFVGASLVVIALRRVLKSLDIAVNAESQSANEIRKQGLLKISDIQLIYSKQDKTCTVDFRVTNQGNADIQINRVKFETISVSELQTMGYMEFSKIYDLDISELKKSGDSISCNISQLVKSGESDRFGITLIARKLGTGVFRIWKLKSILLTNFGEVTTESIEVWLPEKIEWLENFGKKGKKKDYSCRVPFEWENGIVISSV